MPPERVLRFLLTEVASFRGLSPAPSHHLGVDVFVRTFGCPVVALDVGDHQSIETSSRSVGPSLRRPAKRAPARMGSARLVAEGSGATQGTPPQPTSERNG